MHISGKHLFILAAAAVLICTIISAGCIGSISPLPNEVKIKGNIISVDEEYITPDTILDMLFYPNEYNKELFDAVDAYLPPEEPVIQLGIGSGALAAYVNRLLETKGDHVGVEPNPYLMPLLEKTKDTNSLGMKLSGYAVAYGKDTVPMKFSRNLLDSSITPNQEKDTINVPAATIKKIINENDFQQETNITLITEYSGAAADIFTNEPSIKSAVKTVIAGEWDVSSEDSALLIRKASNAGYKLTKEYETGTDGLKVFVFTRIEN